MRRYETFVIIDPDISEEQRAPVVERITDIIAKENGLLAMVDEWGTRKLAYEIKKKPRGYYIRIDFCGTGSVVDEMERFFRIDDRVMKYMTVLLDKEVDLEKIKEDMAKAEAEKEALAAQKAQAAEQSVEAVSETAEIPEESKAEAVEIPEESKTEAVEIPEEGKTEAVEEPKAPEAETDAEAPSSEEGDSETENETESVEPATAETESKKEE